MFIGRWIGVGDGGSGEVIQLFATTRLYMRISGAICAYTPSRRTGSQRRPYQLLFFTAIVYLAPSQFTTRAVCTWNFPFFLITEMRGIVY